MSKIDLRNFVDINIQSKVPPRVSGSRDTVILYTSEGNDKNPIKVSNSTKLDGFISLDSFATTYGTDMPNTLAYLKVFFDNKGVKCIVKPQVQMSELTSQVITNLEDEYILVAYASAESDVATDYASLKTLAKNMLTQTDPEVYGINEKVILARTNINTDTDEVKNFVVKFSSIQGAEMTIAAYLTRIDVYGANTVNDYAFTPEKIKEENITDESYKLIINNNENVDIYLANNVRNCGGNCKDGIDIVNNYVRIILHQTLTNQLISLLSEKIKNSNGVAKIYTTCCAELDKYLINGYLTTDKVWTDDDYIVTKPNGVTYTIIEKGTPLLNGYNVTVLPLTSLTDDEIKAHKAPDIYIIIADQYGIRKITINGEVI